MASPVLPDSLLAAGEAALRAGRLDTAVDHLLQAAALGGAPAGDRVLACFGRALAAGAMRSDLHHWHAVVLLELGHIDQAIAAFRSSLAIEPRQPGTQFLLATALMRRAVLDEAIAAYREAIRLVGQARGHETFLASIHSDLGYALMIHGEQEAAIQALRRALALAPTAARHAQLVYYLSYLPTADASAILREAREWDRLYAPAGASAARHDNAPDPVRRLRIGYVSADFREHAVASFLPPVFERHDREQFEVIAYSNVGRPDHVTAWLRAHSDRWRDIVAMDDEAAAEQIRDDEVDILVDLSMHTGGARPLVFARKPAPIQVCWLAYAGTTGLRAMDYRATDPHLDPPESDGEPYRRAYSERPLRLADTFWCYRPQEPSVDVGPLPARASGRVTFGCCNNFSKVHDGTLKLWARVLSATSGSRLLLVVPSFTAQDRVRNRLKSLGVHRDRLELVGRQRMRDYMATYRRIDIGLDTLPCAGGTTSLDAFYMGVPVVTQVGRTVAGRAGVCFARNLGLPELIGSTADEYVRAATRLAADIDRLEALRLGMRARIAASPLMDEVRFVGQLERGYRDAWKAWCADATSVADRADAGR